MAVRKARTGLGHHHNHDKRALRILYGACVLLWLSAGLDSCAWNWTVKSAQHQAVVGSDCFRRPAESGRKGIDSYAVYNYDGNDIMITSTWDALRPNAYEGRGNDASMTQNTG